MAVKPQGELVQVVPHMGQPFGALDHTVEIVAVGDPQASPVGGGVDGLFHHVDAPKRVAQKAARKFVVVARHKHHTAALACAAQQFLHHVVVGLRPEPLTPQLPAVHDVAHQVQVVAGVPLQKIEQSHGLAAGCAQVQVGNKNAAVPLAHGAVVTGITGITCIHGSTPHAALVSWHVEGAAHHAPRKCLR